MKGCLHGLKVPTPFLVLAKLPIFFYSVMKPFNLFFKKGATEPNNFESGP